MLAIILIFIHLATIYQLHVCFSMPSIFIHLTLMVTKSNHETLNLSYSTYLNSYKDIFPSILEFSSLQSMNNYVLLQINLTILHSFKLLLIITINQPPLIKIPIILSSTNGLLGIKEYQIYCTKMIQSLFLSFSMSNHHMDKTT
jgi:L-rhamnose mutarotase